MQSIGSIIDIEHDTALFLLKVQSSWATVQIDHL